MASSSLRIFIAIAIVAIGIVVSPTLATDYVVGEDNGWMLNFDYQGWGQGKDFRVGDNLMNGRKWYICGVRRHCATGNLKLAITVLPLLQSPAASPSTGAAPTVSPSAAAGIAISKYYSWMVGVFSTIVMIIMV